MACGASVVVGAFLHPAPELHEQDLIFHRADGSPIEVNEQTPLLLPHRFGDYDMWAEIEVPEGGEVDLVQRLAEPTLRAHGLEPFHARFTVARMSTVKKGEAVRTREQALFADDPAATARGGVLVGGGFPATVTVSARGRRLDINLGGTKLEPVETTDAHGEIAVLARGGTALIRKLQVTYVPRPLRLLPIGYAAIAGGIAGLLAVMIGAMRRRRAFRATFVLPLCAWCAGRWVFHHELPEAEPETLALVLGACSGLPLFLALAVPARVRFVPVCIALLCGAAALEVAARIEKSRLRHFEDPRLTAYFGEDSGSAPFDALARRIYSRDAVHGVTAAGERVVFLGGENLFEANDRDHWIPPLACARASQGLAGRKFDGATLPTFASHTRQQIACFERFYRPVFGTRAVVLVVPPWEGQPDVPASAVAALDGIAPAAPSSLVLFDLLRRSSEPRVVATGAEALARETWGFVDRCRDAGIVVLPGIDRGLDATMTAAMVAEAKRRAAPLLRLSPIDEPDAAIAEIGDGLADLMR